MTQFREFVTPVQRGRLPAFVRSDYPAFEKFIIDYFGFLEEDEGALRVLLDWQSNNDPGNNVEGYIDAILRDLGWTWDGSLKVSKHLLLKNLREFYLSRGTFRSFEFLFRTLFDQSVQVRYPREQMLHLDLADYASEVTVYTTADNRLDPAFLTILQDVDARRGVEIVGQISGAVATVESVRTLLSGEEAYLQISILPPTKEFIAREDVMLYSESGFVIESSHAALNVTVTTPGYGYKPGDEITVTGAGLDGLIQVASVFPGSVESVTIVDPGEGYSVGDIVVANKDEEDLGFGFFGVVQSVDGTGAITGISIKAGGREYKKIPTLRVTSSTGAGARVAASSTSIGGINRVKVFQPYVDFDTVVFSSGGTATFSAAESATFESRRYRDRRGVLGENSVLIDSDRFQQFSYDLYSPVAKDRQRKVVDDLLHPVGYVRTDVLKFDEGTDNEVLDDTSTDVETGVQDVILKTLGGSVVRTLSGNLIQIRT